MFKILLTLILLVHWNTASAGLLGISLKDRIVPNANGKIELCWFTAKNSTTRPLQEKIEAYVQEQLNLRAGLNISFVGLCLEHSNPMAPIGISFYDAADNTEGINNTLLGLVPTDSPGHPTTYHQGRYTQGNLVEIVLSSRLEQVRPSLVEQAKGLSEKGLESLYLSIALHEILHALGLSHENNRPDSVCSLEKDKTYHSASFTLIGNYDPVSLMNPCHTKVYNFESDGPIILSNGDILALQSIYSLNY